MMPTRAVLASFVLLGSILSLSLHAQDRGQDEPKLRLRKVQWEEVATPDYEVKLRGRSTNNDGRRNWLELSAEYDALPKWTDEVTLTFYVVLTGDPEDMKEGEEAVNLFSGTVTYRNVKQGRYVATMFMDPNTFERYGKPSYVAVIAAVNGENESGKANPESSAQSQWWTRKPPHSIPLMNRSESPWALVEIESHNTIQP